MRGRERVTLRDVKARLIGDSIERRRLVEKLVTLVRADERERVMNIRDKARSER